MSRSHFKLLLLDKVKITFIRIQTKKTYFPPENWISLLRKDNRVAKNTNKYLMCTSILASM